MSTPSSRPPKKSDRAAGAHEAQGVLPGLGGADRLDDDVGALRRRPAPRRTRARARAAPPAPDDDDVRARVLRRRAEHEPDRPRPQDRDRLPGLDPGPLDSVQAAGERLDHGGDLRRERRRDGEEVALGDPRRHEQVARRRRR